MSEVQGQRSPVVAVMTKVAKIVIGVVVALVLVIWLAETVYDFLRGNPLGADACLDSGGRWISSEKRCEHGSNSQQSTGSK